MVLLLELTSPSRGVRYSEPRGSKNPRGSEYLTPRLGVRALILPQLADLFLLLPAWSRFLDGLGRLNREAFFLGLVGVALLLGPQVHLDRHVAEREVIAQRLEQIALIGAVE